MSVFVLTLNLNNSEFHVTPPVWVCNRYVFFIIRSAYVLYVCLSVYQCLNNICVNILIISVLGFCPSNNLFSTWNYQPLHIKAFKYRSGGKLAFNILLSAKSPGKNKLQQGLEIKNCSLLNFCSRYWAEKLTRSRLNDKTLLNFSLFHGI